MLKGRSRTSAGSGRSSGVVVLEAKALTQAVSAVVDRRRADWVVAQQPWLRLAWPSHPALWAMEMEWSDGWRRPWRANDRRLEHIPGPMIADGHPQRRCACLVDVRSIELASEHVFGGVGPAAMPMYRYHVINQRCSS